jgi:biopolymer transport protein ExbB
MEKAPIDLNLDLFSLVQQGALSTYPLLFCSILLFGIVLERMWSLRGIIGATHRLTRAVEPLLAKGDVAGAASAAGNATRTAAGRLVADLLSRPEAPTRELERLAEERQFEEVQGCGAYLWVLGTIAAAAPFIGLFGTVIGIIRAFHTMSVAGTGGFSVVASGISEALIATALGLAVGIVALVFYNYLQSKVERIDAALQIGSARVLQALTAGRSDDGIMAEINVTPLTDVFLVLLIIFMVTTSAMMKPNDVELPEAKAEEEETQGVVVSLTPSREMYVNDRPVSGDDANLLAVLRDALAVAKDKVVILAGDKGVVLGEVVRVLGVAKEAGAKGFALASE